MRHSPIYTGCRSSRQGPPFVERQRNCLGKVGEGLLVVGSGAIRRGHPKLRTWGAGYDTTWRPYFEYLDLHTGTISSRVRKEMRARESAISASTTSRSISGPSRGWSRYTAGACLGVVAPARGVPRGYPGR